jgi:integrase
VLLIRNFCRLARHYGCQVVPELNVKVPKSQRSRRTQTFTSDEFHDLVDALEEFIAPDTEDGLYLRDWGLGAAKARQVVPKVVNQDLERSRREMLRFFVLVAAASGCRPHELAGEEDGSLRWRDVEFKDVLVKVSLSQREPTPKTVAILKVRELTKTGERSVPMVGGKYLKQLKAWSRFSGPDDFVFCDQYGIRAGKPPYMDSLRLQWREVLRRMGFTRFKPDLYSLRHYFATQRLQSGAPPYLVAKTLGHSIQELTNVYAHVLMENEGVIRQVWRETTPEPLQEMGVVVSEPWELR